MPKKLWVKFFILLVVVSAVALSSSVMLRTFIVDDFRKFQEGEMEDRVYWVMADLEGSFEKYGSWRKDLLAEDAVWAFLLGLETRVSDENGDVVMETAKALAQLPPRNRERVLAVAGSSASDEHHFIPYPLFLAGRQIGLLEVRFLAPDKRELFIDRSNRFLLISSLVLGGLAAVLSIVFARRLTRPIQRLSDAADAISIGNFKARVVVTAEDEIGRLSAGFNKMAHTLEIQDSLRKKLCSNAAHELRTPLTVMRGELEGMMDGLIPVERRQLQSLHEEAGRLAGILDAMEELLQAEASVLTLRKEPLSLHPFLDNIMRRYRPLFEEKGVSLDAEVNALVRIAADPDRLSQIIINLISNALKATERGGRVRIRAQEDQERTVIEVEDTGCGIAEVDLPFIFERFYRVSQGGFGLGLTIVKELVEAHGGRMGVKSEVGNGSLFTLSFPREKHLHNLS